MKSLREYYYNGSGLGIQKLLEDITDYTPPDGGEDYSPHAASVKPDSSALKNLLTIEDGGTDVYIKLGIMTVGMLVEDSGSWYVFLNGDSSKNPVAQANSKEEAFGKYINYLMEQ
jgi:hypothetical protein